VNQIVEHAPEGEGRDAPAHQRLDRGRPVLPIGEEGFCDTLARRRGLQASSSTRGEALRDLSINRFT
jgi:hypothetical protein